MAENSLFAILLRQRWWVSASIAVAIGVVYVWAAPAGGTDEVWIEAGRTLSSDAPAGWSVVAAPPTGGGDSRKLACSS